MPTGVVVSTREVNDSASLTVSEGVNVLVLNASHGVYATIFSQLPCIYTWQSNTSTIKLSQIITWSSVF
jgi:hypothetical protein